MVSFIFDSTVKDCFSSNGTRFQCTLSELLNCHKSDCAQHKRCMCEEPRKCKCLDECGCREYASPSLTWSKVGVVLHLQWREEDGTLFTIDCDLNCPTWPTHTRFDSNINPAERYLRTKQPVGWLEERSKLEMMSSAASAYHLLTSKTSKSVRHVVAGGSTDNQGGKQRGF